MNRFLRTADRLSTVTGHAASWLILVLVAITVFEVASRYLFNAPHAWVLDLTIMSFGAMVILGGAYALSQQNHVRGDILYGMLEPRTQAVIDLTLYVVFFTPGVMALVWAGYGYAADSWSTGERSALTSNGLPVYPLKALIPLAGALLMLQGVAEMLRCMACIRDGVWASRRGDVQEVDVEKLKALVASDPHATAVQAAATRSAA
ncbi:MAG: TRAP transporter small permease subunit [Polaromonas sp.]|nr:TRAP transporter small permease subunit [Polaromonas sp.]